MAAVEVEKKQRAGRVPEASDSATEWFEFEGSADLPSPALLVYRDRVEENLRRMIAMAGGTGRLRPHIKTHKIREVIDLKLALGITKFKCATIAEAEMAAEAGVTDLLLAYQPVGPNVKRVVEMMGAFPKTRFSVLCDNEEGLEGLEKGIKSSGRRIEVLIDLDVGQHRTGILPGLGAVELYQKIASSNVLNAGGLHAYDGHLSDPDRAQREAACNAAFAPVMALRNEMLKAGLSVPRIVVGGTPTFPIHAKRPEVECSPGTCVFWDASEASKLTDMDYFPAALVLTRVISKPGPNRLCLDLGHKALGSEMPHPRVQFLNLQDAQAVVHSEEHLVVETTRAADFKIGDLLYGMPRHICPTVALHAEATVIENGKIVETWKVAARTRKIRI